MEGGLTQRYYSKIYWHFTGSPEGINWHEMRRPQHIKQPPKNDNTAVEILQQILRSKRLKATSTELIANYIETPRFCCVCDIPFKDLPFHARYYGRVAIGFHAASIHASRFNPVLYINHDRLLELISLNDKVPADHPIPGSTPFDADESPARLFTMFFAPALKPILGRLAPYIKMSEFSTDDEKTFYREREWRHIGDFCFSLESIAAVLIPDELVGGFRQFLMDDGIGEAVTVIPWSFVHNA